MTHQYFCVCLVGLLFTSWTDQIQATKPPSYSITAWLVSNFCQRFPCLFCHETPAARHGCEEPDSWYRGNLHFAAGTKMDCCVSVTLETILCSWNNVELCPAMRFAGLAKLNMPPNQLAKSQALSWLVAANSSELHVTSACRFWEKEERNSRNLGVLIMIFLINMFFCWR